MNDDERTFGEWLEDSYNEADMTQAEFAARAGVGQSTVSAWVRGVQPPNDHNCVRIAEALGLDPNDVRVRAGRKPRQRRVHVRSDDPIASLNRKVDEALELIRRLVEEREREDDHK